MLLKVVDPYRLAGSRRVDELMVAQIDADVRERTAHGVEKHQVARFEFVLGYRGAGLADFARTVRQDQAQALAVNVSDESRTVEAGLGFVAATMVADADQIAGAVDDLLNVVAIAGQSGFGVRRLGRRCVGEGTSRSEGAGEEACPK